MRNAAGLRRDYGGLAWAVVVRHCLQQPGGVDGTAQARANVKHGDTVVGVTSRRDGQQQGRARGALRLTGKARRPPTIRTKHDRD